MLRKAKITDIPSIKELIDEAAKSHKVLPRSETELRKVIRSFFVWEENNKIVGCCSLEVYSKKLAEIRSLVVDLYYRKNGIGKQLVAACMEKAKELQIYEVLTITEKDAFFEKMGFSKCLGGQWALFMRP